MLLLEYLILDFMIMMCCVRYVFEWFDCFIIGLLGYVYGVILGIILFMDKYS